MHIAAEREKSVLVVDDERNILEEISLILRAGAVQAVSTVEESREVLPFLRNNKVSVVILDWLMPRITGAELLPKLVNEFPHIPVIVLTALGEVETAVRCLKNGAFDFLTKPVDPNRLISSVEKALQISDLHQQNRLLREYLLDDRLHDPQAFSQIITCNKKMRGIFQYVEAIASSRQPVLITGETGVGKELIARAIHSVSGVPGEFVSINVAGLDDFAFSDTLFGHRRGAYTGAVAKREGLICKASGGTLFLDEIGDLNEESQIKLLRLVQEHEYYRLGSDALLKSDARIVAASNKDFAQLRERGRFRNDLYYRLCTHEFHVPALRERKEDIPLLVNHFVEKIADSIGRARPEIDPELYPFLLMYDYPGNVRELYNRVHNAVNCNLSGTLTPRDFAEIKDPVRRKKAIMSVDKKRENPLNTLFGRFPTVEEMEQYLIVEAMKVTRGNQTAAAELLGMTRPTLNKRLNAKK